VLPCAINPDCNQHAIAVACSGNLYPIAKLYQFANDHIRPDQHFDSNHHHHSNHYPNADLRFSKGDRE
jgi:hypothetical protein